MGIQNFQPFIKKVYGNACSNKWNDVKYDNLYVDLNHVLHHVCYLSSDTKDLLSRFMDYLRGIIRTISPKKRVILAADGPAPLAKMILQRKRRLDSVKLSDDIDAKKKLNLNLTPGTEFMMNLEKSLAGFIKYVNNTYNVQVITMITDPDEGEIKIKYQLQKMEKRYPDETHIVYSGDSDMILLLFTCDDLSKVYQALTKDTIIHFGTMYDIHIEKYGKTDSTKYDFVFINLLMGNDYLPKVALIKLENLWEAYKTIAITLNHGIIKREGVKITVDPVFINDLLYTSTKKSPKHIVNRFKLSDVKDGSYEGYVQGLYWCFGMYATGNCSNYKYIYEHTGTIHPQGVGLAIAAMSSYEIIRTKAIDVDLYGILLIPEKANQLLSKEQNVIVKELVKKHPIIYEEGRCKKCNEMSKKISDLNSQQRQLRKSNRPSEDDDDMTEDEKSNDENKETLTQLSKQIGRVCKQFTVHRETHGKLTFEKIEDISKTFVNIRREVRESNSKKHNFDNDDGEVVEEYKPFAAQTKLLKRKLFRK